MSTGNDPLVGIQIGPISFVDEGVDDVVDDSRLLLGEFVGAARGEVQPATTGRDHLKSLGVVRACIESIETGQWVDMANFYGTLGIPPAMLSAAAG
jgi:hypothetical protein